MTSKSNKLSSLLAALVVIISTSPARAITNGFPDTTNTFSNVGAVVAVGTDGKGFQICSGTLISPTVFLTVAHCALYFNDFLAPEGFKLYISFGNPIPILELTDVNTLIPSPSSFQTPSTFKPPILTLLTRTTVAILATWRS